MSTPQLIWDTGTAYDLFVSLYTLHHPKRFGLRGAWAVGVRSRLPLAEREFFQEVMPFFGWPIDWVYEAVPAPKDAQTTIDILADIPPAQRWPRLHRLHLDPEYEAIILPIATRGRWTAADETQIHRHLAKRYEAHGESYKRKDLSVTLKWWTQVELFGERLLSALREYQQVFFREDEIRIRPALKAAVAEAQKLAAELPLAQLLETLSQGVKFDRLPQANELVLAPSFWGSPLILAGDPAPQRQVILFGGRPANASIVPGELIPDALFTGLKALADPTRLRILRYLIAEPLTPTELAKRLRLRPPTVVHHLDTLRLARLVHVTLSVEGRRYQARREAVAEIDQLLRAFLDEP